jgi:preprotein translocase subunit SecD
MIYKLAFIIALIVFALALILPTVGEKKMQVFFFAEPDAVLMQKFEQRFPADGYVIEKAVSSIIVSGTNLTDAIMNEVRTFDGVRDAVFMKHWAEDYLLAKKINLGLDLQGGMHLVLQADFDKIEKKTGKPLTASEKNELTQQALELLRNRIDKFGVSEPSYVQGQ